jgi:hypothetical protein
MSRWHEDCPYDSTSGLRNWSCRATTTAISVSPSNNAYHQSKSCRQGGTPAICTLRTGAAMFRQLVCHHHLKRACPGEIDHSDKRTPQRVTISSRPPVGRLRARRCCEPRCCNFWRRFGRIARFGGDSAWQIFCATEQNITGQWSD